MFAQLDDNVWLNEATVSFGGLPLPHSMTVIRMPNGGLFVHSPTRLNASTRVELEQLGPVDSIVFPSWWHDLYLLEYSVAYPNAKLFGSPPLVHAHAKIPSITPLDAQQPIWAPEIEQIYVDRMGLCLDEFVFFHRPSRSLIVADLAFNLDDDRPSFTKWSYWFVGAYPGCNIPWFYRFMPRDRRCLREKIERILAWDFDRLIVGHGDVVRSGGKSALRNAYRWLLN